MFEAVEYKKKISMNSTSLILFMDGTGNFCRITSKRRRTMEYFQLRYLCSCDTAVLIRAYVKSRLRGSINGGTGGGKLFTAIDRCITIEIAVRAFIFGDTSRRALLCCANT